MTGALCPGLQRGLAALGRQLAQKDIKDGGEHQAEQGDTHHAGEHGNSHGAAHFGACTAGQHQRHDARNKGDRGHENGAQPHAACVHDCADQLFTPVLQLFSKLNDQNRVFTSQAHQHHQSHFGEDVVVRWRTEKATDPNPQHRTQDAHGNDQQDR